MIVGQHLAVQAPIPVAPPRAAAALGTVAASAFSALSRLFAVLWKH